MQRIRPSVASAFGRLMSIGSSATNTRPSGAQATTEGCLTFGASATSSIRQPAIGCGKTEAPEAAELHKSRKATKSGRAASVPLDINRIDRFGGCDRQFQERSDTRAGRSCRFPLTLTLSLREREQRAPRSDRRKVWMVLRGEKGSPSSPGRYVFSVVGTSRCDVRAACSGATPSNASAARLFVPPATTRAGTAQRAIPTIALKHIQRERAG